MKLTILNEGAWGHGPLENDSASDQKWEIARNAIKGLDTQMVDKSNPDAMYHAVGLWLDLVEKLETNYGYFTDDILSKYHAVAETAVEWLLDNPDELINNYRNPDEATDIMKDIQTKIKNFIKDLPELKDTDGTVGAAGVGTA